MQKVFVAMMPLDDDALRMETFSNRHNAVRAHREAEEMSGRKLPEAIFELTVDPPLVGQKTEDSH